MKRDINSLSVNLFGNPDNQPIIFVHGFPFDHTMWMNQINFLIDDYYCIAYDIRGLGESYVGDGQYTMEAYVYDLFSIIETLQLKNPIICGLSMGGYITLRALELNQSLFKAAILCDTKADADNDKGKLARSNFINKINTEGVGAFAESFISNCFAEESKTELRDLYNAVVERAKKRDPIGVKGALFAMLSRTSTKRSLKKIKIPTLVLVGVFDKLTPVKVMKDMSESLPDCEFGIAPRAGHMAPLENPGFINDMIKGFLKRKF